MDYLLKKTIETITLIGLPQEEMLLANRQHIFKSVLLQLYKPSDVQYSQRDCNSVKTPTCTQADTFLQVTLSYLKCQSFPMQTSRLPLLFPRSIIQSLIQIFVLESLIYIFRKQWKGQNQRTYERENLYKTNLDS